jgi:hypothetical protein
VEGLAIAGAFGFGTSRSSLMRPRVKEALPNLVSLSDRCHRLMHHEPDSSGWSASSLGRQMFADRG